MGRGVGNSAIPTCDFEAPNASTVEDEVRRTMLIPLHCALRLCVVIKSIYRIANV